MEPHIHGEPATGWIEVICGGMFSGKTEELIRRLKRAQIARQRVAVFKPRIDTRYAPDAVVSHSEQALPSMVVASAREIMDLAREAQVVGIDEGQFFGAELVEVCQLLAQEGKRVIVAGLDMDYRGQPFEPIPQLLAIAEYITKLHAICVRCGAPAQFSQRLISRADRVLLGAADLYEPRCRRCFEPPGI
jgi:thymidine kinase|nr:MAG: thymidine kinase [Bacteroidota bacterium]